LSRKHRKELKANELELLAMLQCPDPRFVITEVKSVHVPGGRPLKKLSRDHYQTRKRFLEEKKRQSEIQARIKEMEASDEKGRRAEERFIEALREKPFSWIIDVYRSTHKEDLYEATDAWVVVKHFRNSDGSPILLRIQVKSSFDGILLHRENHPDFVGIVIKVREDDDNETIRLRFSEQVEISGMLRHKQR
jgi:hypothetical protein